MARAEVEFGALLLVCFTCSLQKGFASSLLLSTTNEFGTGPFSNLLFKNSVQIISLILCGYLIHLITSPVLLEVAFRKHGPHRLSRILITASTAAQLITCILYTLLYFLGTSQVHKTWIFWTLLISEGIAYSCYLSSLFIINYLLLQAYNIKWKQTLLLSLFFSHEVVGMYLGMAMSSFIYLPSNYFYYFIIMWVLLIVMVVLSVVLWILLTRRTTNVQVFSSESDAQEMNSSTADASSSSVANTNNNNKFYLRSFTPIASFISKLQVYHFTYALGSCCYFVVTSSTFYLIFGYAFFSKQNFQQFGNSPSLPAFWLRLLISLVSIVAAVPLNVLFPQLHDRIFGEAKSNWGTSCAIAAFAVLPTFGFGYGCFFYEPTGTLIILYFILFSISMLLLHCLHSTLHYHVLHISPLMTQKKNKQKRPAMMIGIFLFNYVKAASSFVGVLVMAIVGNYVGLDIPFRVLWALLVVAFILLLVSGFLHRQHQDKRAQILRDEEGYRPYGGGFASAANAVASIYHKFRVKDFLEDDDQEHQSNILFYRNQIPSKPNGDFIDKIHKEWYSDFDLLEEHHSYIQWIFPIRETGLNGEAQPLTKYEAEVFRKDPEMRCRLMKSYAMMLEFYGLQMKDPATGEIERVEAIWKSRFYHLNHSFHNYLRITRILKCLGIMGFENHKLNLIKFFVKEVFVNHQLENVRRSLVDYWIPTIRLPQQREEINELVLRLSSGRTRCDLATGDEYGKSNWATQYYEPIPFSTAIEEETSATTTTTAQPALQLDAVL